jgi:plasmid stabilization system protein ParE
MARRSIEFAVAARADLLRLKAHLEPESPRAAQRAVDRIITGIELLADFPEMGVRYRGAFRTLYLRFGNSAYVVRYRVSDDTILITRIWHGRERRR